MRPDKPLRSRLQIGAIPSSCREIMKRPVLCVRNDETVQDAAQLMRDHDLGFVPVSDAGGVVIGVLTDRDVVTRVCASGERSCDLRVETIMTRDVIACRATDRLSRAIALMRRHRLTRVLVTDTVGRAVGVISLSDLAQYERPWRIGRTLQTVAERKYAPERP
jgi:CBS domain-containing protein